MKRTDKLAQLLTGMLADFGASWKFIFIFLATGASWMTWNTLPATKAWHFDEYPFIFMNLALSFLAAAQAPVIIMAANHQAKRDRKEVHEIAERLKKLEDKHHG